MSIGLSPKRAAFVRNYLKNGGNATQAYVDAGYSKGGADRAAYKLLRIAEIAALVETKRAVKEVTADRNAIADLHECEARLTEEMRGEIYAQDIADLEGDLSELRASLEGMKKVQAANGLSPEAFAHLSAAIATTADSVIQVRVQIKNLRVKQRSEQNAAAVTLMKSKGAFDPRFPAVTDVGAILNGTLRNIMASKWKPNEELSTWLKEAEDAIFAVEPGDDAGVTKALPGGTARAADPVLFTRKNPKQAPSRSA